MKKWIIVNKYAMLDTFLFLYEEDDILKYLVTDKKTEKWLVKKDELRELFECVGGTTFEEIIQGMETYFGPELFGTYLAAAEEWGRTKREPEFGIERKKTEFIYCELDPLKPECILALRKKEYIKWFKDELQRWLDMRSAAQLTDALNDIQERGLKEWLLNTTHNFPNVPSYMLGTFGHPLKPGRFIRKFHWAKDTLSKDTLSLMGEYLAIELRKNRVEQPEIKVSDTPSEIYILDGLHQSCMRNMDQNTFELYDDIPSCRIAYMTQDEDLIGRALLWDEVKVIKGHNWSVTIKLMDRIYFNNDDIRDAFLVWAREHGYWVKKEQSLGCYEFRNPNTGEIHHMPMMHVNAGFTFEENMYGGAPYLDTFPKLRIGDNKLCSYCDHSTKGEPVNLQSTEGAGGVLTGNYACKVCGNLTRHYIIYEGESYCEECFYDEFTDCEVCGEMYNREDITWGYFDEEEQYVCSSCLSRYTQSRTNPEHWWSDDRCMDAYDEGGRNVTLTPDDLEDYEECAICGELHHYNNTMEDKYGDKYCEYCYENDVKDEDKH